MMMATLSIGGLLEGANDRGALKVRLKDLPKAKRVQRSKRRRLRVDEVLSPYRSRDVDMREIEPANA
jgi:hypothetical protein